MNKKAFLVLTMILMVVTAYAERIAIAPFIKYDQNSARIEIEYDFNSEIYERLEEEWFDGLVTFDNLTSESYGDVYTILDANKVCVAGEYDYILYGYIQKNENSWYSNLKLYSSLSKKIEKEFFASDDINNTVRFVEILQNNVVTGIYELSGLEISGKKPLDIVPFKINLMLEGYYWNPIVKKWNNVIAGIAGGSLGVDLIPPQKKFTVNKKLIYISLGFICSYAYGKNKENEYPLTYQTVQVALPFNLHFDYNKYNSFFIKIAPFYEFEFLNVIEKYKEEEFHYQNIPGFEAGIGYEFFPNDRCSVYVKCDYDFHFSNDKFMFIKPGLGSKIKLN